MYPVPPPPSHTHTHQEPVLLLSVVLALVGPIYNMQLVEWGTVAHHLGLQSPPNVLLALDFLFSLLNDAHDTV